jgi:hypothetical protein
MEPWQSWATFIVLSGGVGYYYLNTHDRKKAKAAIPIPSEKQERPEKTIRRRRLDDTVVDGGSGSDRSSKKAARRKKAIKSSEKTPQWIGSEDDHHPQDEQQDQEFAQHMIDLKSGPSTKQQSNGKAPKQAITPLPLNPSITVQSAQSSVTEGEADDDLSSTGSPVVHNVGGISDMLEAPPPAAGVLRITDPIAPPRPSRQQQEKAFQVQETKRQRQNRRKNEERKAQREADEQERRKIMDQHLKAARQNESKQARTDAASSAATNAWAKPKPHEHVVDAPAVSGGAARTSMLLDTFDGLKDPDHRENQHLRGGVPGHHGNDHVVRTPAVSPGAAETNLLLDMFDTNEPISNPSSKRASVMSNRSGHGVPEYEKGLPSEAEQMRMLNELNGWSKVESKKAKKTKTSSAGDSKTSAEEDNSDGDVDHLEVPDKKKKRASIGDRFAAKMKDITSRHQQQQTA